jgi:hypothetical protein
LNLAEATSWRLSSSLSNTLSPFHPFKLNYL